MAENSKIQWTDHTFNPWRGCARVAEGCRFCYAEALAKRFPNTNGTWGANGSRVVAAPSAWRDPLRWNRKASDRQRVFCASLADVFEDWQGPMIDHHGDRLLHPEGSHEAVYGDGPNVTMCDIRGRLFDLVDQTPKLDWLFVTKRPENIRDMWWGDQVTGFRPMRRQNAWLLTSIACQADIKRNLPHLVRCRNLVPVLGLSIEPLIGPVDIGGYLQRIDWVIVGGESGPNARPCRVEWIRHIVRQCQAAGVPCFVKQLGTNAIETIRGSHSPTSPACWLGRVTDPKGGDPNEWPEDLRVLQFPEVQPLAVSVSFHH